MTQTVIPIKGPFKGVVSDLPTPGDLQAFDDVNNFLCRKGRIQTRPRLNAFGAPPDGALVRYIGTFQDADNNYHTLVLTTQNAYMITAGPVWHLLINPVGTLAGTALPYGLEKLISRVYFSNGSAPVLYSDGETSLKVAGDVPGAARFMAQNTDHLILAYTTEPSPLSPGALDFPRRVRWSASGNPDEWDPGVDFTAGFADQEEVPDVITGLLTLGRNTYIFHEAGVIIMYPTGNGVIPYAFEDYILGPAGFGNMYPYALASAGAFGISISFNEIWKFSGNSIDPIGLGNKKRIFDDLQQSTLTGVTGRCIPALGQGFDYSSYWLSIPGPNVTWIYSFDDGNWQRFTSADGYLTSLSLASVA